MTPKFSKAVQQKINRLRVSVKAPDGFKKEIGVDLYGMTYLKLVGDNVVVTAIFSYGPEFDRDNDRFVKRVSVAGDVEYKAGDKWYSKSRRGISDAFNWSEIDPESLNDVMTAQIKTGLQAAERGKDMKVCPLVEVGMRPDTIAKYRDRLMAGKSIDLTPGGMGTGYRVSQRRSRYARPVPEVEKFFNVPFRLYAESFDYD